MGNLRQLAATAVRSWEKLDLSDRYRCAILGFTVPMAILLAMEAAQQPDTVSGYASDTANHERVRQARSLFDSGGRSFIGGPSHGAEMTIESASLATGETREMMTRLVPPVLWYPVALMPSDPTRSNDEYLGLSR